MSNPSSFERTVVLDTNAYRIFTGGLSLDGSRKAARRLRALEQAAGCRVLANPITVWELLAHLADPADRGYSYCLHALIALGEHTALPGSSEGGIGMLADSFSTVCKTLFDQPPVALQQALGNLGSLVTHVTKFAPDLTDPTVKSNIELVARGMTEIERRWMQNMTGVLQQFAPGTAQTVFGGSTDSQVRRRLKKFLESDLFFECWSTFIVADHALYAQLPLPTTAEGHRLAGMVREAFATPFYLVRALLVQMLDPRFKLASRRRKRWNFACDTSLSFALGPGTVEGTSLFLVTGDLAIAKAAREAGMESQVVSLAAYLGSVGMRVGSTEEEDADDAP